MYVLLGWNNVGWNNTSTSEEELIGQASVFIENVHNSFPNCKIVLLGLQIPARDGLGVNYGADGIYSKYNKLVNYVHNLNRIYQGLADSISNVSYVNIAGQFDTEHNCITATRKVNVRSNIDETYQSNGVHPALSGYLQIADAEYRDFIHKLQE